MKSSWCLCYFLFYFEIFKCWSYLTKLITWRFILIFIISGDHLLGWHVYFSVFIYSFALGLKGHYIAFYIYFFNVAFMLRFLFKKDLVFVFDVYNFIFSWNILFCQVFLLFLDETLYNQMIQPVLLYKSEAWTINASDGKLIRYKQELKNCTKIQKIVQNFRVKRLR